MGSSRGHHRYARLLDLGHGVSRDPARAAQHMAQAIKQGNPTSINQMHLSAFSWSLRFRVELQKLLIASGVYTGAIDGVFGNQTWRAVKALAKQQEE